MSNPYFFIAMVWLFLYLISVYGILNLDQILQYS